MSFKLATPTNDSSNYEYSTVLDGDEYIIRMTWNETSNSWYINVQAYNGDTVVSGIRMVSHFPLMVIYKSLDTPMGAVVVIQKSSGPTLTPTRESFNDGTHELWYFTENDINEITS
jgi:hypothetical protein